MREVLAVLAGIAVVVKLVVGIISCDGGAKGNTGAGSSYSKSDKEIILTEQDLDNLEFYFEMEHKWDSMR